MKDTSLPPHWLTEEITWIKSIIAEAQQAITNNANWPGYDALKSPLSSLDKKTRMVR